MIRALALALCLLPAPLRAEAQDGSVPDRQAVVAQWLSGAESAALPRLARLAETGDNSARLLLALIDMTAAYQGPWLRGLDRPDRIALMRRPGGLSGQSWLGMAEGPLAQAWRDILDTGAQPEVVLRFVAMGEDRAAVFAARTLKRRQNTELFRAMSAKEVPAFLRRFGAGPLPGGATTSATGPVVGLCQTLCPGDSEACQAIVAEALQGDLALTFSPASGIVPETDWAASKMAQDATLHMVKTSGWRVATPACLAQALSKR